MRIVVVGGGVIGLLTAVECIRSGAQVDLIDQAGLPSPWATSNDLHRVIRALHHGDAARTAAAARAQRAWLEIERLLGVPFYGRTGVLTAMEPSEVGTHLELLAAAGAAGQAISAAELPARCPQVRFPPRTAAVLEPASGVIRAGHALRALAGWLRRQPGARLLPGRRAAAIDDTGAVRLADGSVMSADRLVVAAGPWSRDLLPDDLSRELTLHRQTMLSYAPPAGPAWAGTPAVLGIGPARDSWLMPPAAGSPARLSAASACRIVAGMTDRAAPRQWRDHLVRQFAVLLPGFDPAAVVGAADGYYLAASGGGPVLATTRGGAVVAYAACGGMSFKFAPMIARGIADRATGRPPRATGLDPVDRPRLFTPARRGAVLQEEIT